MLPISVLTEILNGGCDVLDNRVQCLVFNVIALKNGRTKLNCCWCLLPGGGKALILG